MKANRQNVRSTENFTKEKKAVEKVETEDRENEFYMKTVEIIHKLYINQTGQFTITSSKGHKHVMIVHDHDSNAMLARPLKSKSAIEQLRKIQETHKCLNDRGIHPKMHVMDNECPLIMKEYLINSKKNTTASSATIHTYIQYSRESHR